MSVSKKEMKELDRKASEIKNLQASFVGLSDGELKKMFVELCVDFKNKKLKEAELEAYVLALASEVSKRVLGLDPHQCQVMGAIALNSGDVANMATGEGKTLTGAMTAILNVLTKGNVHIVTANEYLARRDAETMSRIYEFLGLKTGLVYNGQSLEEKQQAYQADIVYGTCSEFGFDYLRDNLAKSKESQTGQKHAFAIIDEVDSILIDEATIPMILSERMKINLRLFEEADVFVRGLNAEDYEFSKDKKSVWLSEKGYEKLEKAIDGMASSFEIEEMQYFVDNALKAHHLFSNGKDYVVRDGEIVLIDKNTGRGLEGRKYSKYLHQAIEAKEGVKIEPPSKTNATISVQRYFSKYKKVCGMTGTALAAEDEFSQVYHMRVFDIPTNRQKARVDEGVQVYVSKKAQLNRILSEVKIALETKRPILVGTKTIQESEEIARLLKRNGVPFTLLNANTENEAESISCAGMLGMVTIATNVAGRGTDIKLGGDAEMLTLLQLKVMGVELPVKLQNIIFAENFDSKDELLVYARSLFVRHKSTCEHDRKIVNELGGLRVVVSSLGDSERVTQQLIGRSGRQGDNGSSIMVVSLEDEILSAYVSSDLTKFADAAGRIQANGLDELVVKAENKVESRNRETRLLNLKLETPVHGMREKTYSSRNKILELEDSAEAVRELIHTIILGKLNENAKRKEVNEFLKEVFGEFAVIQAENGETQKPEAIAEKLTEKIMQKREFVFKEILKQAKDGAQAKADIDASIKKAMLSNLDFYWINLLNNLDDVKNGAFLSVYAGRDPFKEMAYNSIKEYQEAMLSAQIDTIKYAFKYLEELAHRLEIDLSQSTLS